MHPTSAPSTHTQKQVAVLRTRALAYPETREDFPWGHSAFKVKGKAFAFLHADAQGFSISVKLPESNSLALQLPFAQPTGYGLGKSGWVSAQFAAREQAPLPLLCEWLDESFRAIAPKRLSASLASAGAPAPAQPKTRAAAKGLKPRAQASAPAVKKKIAKKTAKKTAKRVTKKRSANKVARTR